MSAPSTKRWLILTLALSLLAATLVGCGTQPAASTSGTSSAPPASASASTPSASPSAAVSPYCPKGGTAQAQPDSPDASIAGELTVWGWNNAGAEAVVNDFAKAYPNVTVKLETVGYPDILTKLTTALQAGTGAPDITFLQDGDATRFWDLPLADLTTCMTPHLGDFPEFKVKAISRPDGTIQAVPWEAGPSQLIYRRDVFKKYGIDATSLKTWDDFIAAGQELVKKSNGDNFMFMSNVVGTAGALERWAQTFYLLMQQNGGNLWDVDGNPTFDDPKAIEALELVKKFRDSGITLNDLASDQATYDTLVNGSVAAFVAPTWWTYYPKTFAPATAGLWGGVPLPAFKEGGARSTNLGGTSLAIPTQSKNPEAAWSFLNFWLLRGESRKLSYEKGGYLFENIYKPIADDPIFKQPDPFVGGDPWLANAALLAPEIPQLNITAKSAYVQEELILLLPDFASGKTTAPETLLLLKTALDKR
jgi:lactose/L-arabinose transport system substrate-binding protein